MNNTHKAFWRHPILLLAICALVALLPREGLCADDNTALDAYLERLSLKAKETSCIQSDFTQTKFITFMDEQLESKGFFIFRAPLELEWEYTKPVASGLIYKNGKASLWYAPEAGASAGSAARENASARSGAPENVIAKVIAEHLITWTNLDIDVLKKNYSIKLVSEKPLTIMLTPKIRIPGSPVNDFKVIFAANEVDVAQLFLYEADDDYTRIDFHNLVRR